MKRLLALSLLAAGVCHAQVPYNASPDWRSTDRRYATGGALVDLNGDRWPELVVANGNDMRSERNGLYLNNAGTLPTAPTWESADLGMHGHLAVGDVNADGYPDVAITVLRPGSGPGVKLYMNRGGTLEATPSWTSQNGFYGWHAAFGDPDLDGDLDLLVGSSDAYGSGRWQNFIYFNDGGALSRTPGWSSIDNRNLDHMEFCDVDDDGDLDVVAIGSGTYNWIYRNRGGAIDTVPDWQSTDNSRQFANTLALGDVNGDRRPDLVMSDNNQLSGGSGYVKLYRNDGAGAFEQTPGWRYFDGYVSGVALADINRDGLLDLATGAWWDNARIFLNNGSGFNAAPDWSSAVRPVIEAIVFGDVDRDGIRVVTAHMNLDTGRVAAERPIYLRTPGNVVQTAPRKLYQLNRQPVERIVGVAVDGRWLGRGEYCFNATTGWVALKDVPVRSVQIVYEYSEKPEMVITDWENNGNIMFRWRGT